MNPDEQLLNNKRGEQGSADRAGSFREAQRGNSGDETTNDGSPARDEQLSLREATQEAKKEKAAQEEKEGGAGDKLASAATAPIRQGTSKLLQQAWLHLVDSWGLTLIWIDIHVWLGTIFGDKFFCKLGGEWLDNNIKTAQEDYAKSQGKTLGTVEPMVLACCNLGCLLILISVIFLVAMIMGVIENPLRAIYEVLKIIVGNLWK